ncbi:MAG TPA: class IV adenylate cyclase [Candidatus Paceibacterota bacterium]
MANNLIEVEVKFKIDDLSILEEKIKAVGAKELHKNIFQRTVKMDTPDESLRQKGVFLRVRDGEKKIMTVKSKLPELVKNFKEREELEIEISDVELAEKMLKVLGFTQKRIMEKYRTEYELEGTILALDRLPFGNYLEIEGDKDLIEKVIKILGLENLERNIHTYWHLFDEYKKANNLQGEDIVF